MQVAAAGDKQAAEDATVTVPYLAQELWCSMPAIWRRMQDAATFHGSLVVMGFSNGALAATAWALENPGKVRALLLCSGSPSACQLQTVTSGWRTPPPTAMTIGNEEPPSIHSHLFSPSS